MTHVPTASRRTLLAAAGCAALVRPSAAPSASPVVPPALVPSGLIPAPAGAATALPVPAQRRLAFRVTRNDSAIGTHELVFTPSGQSLLVRVTVDLAVRFGPIPLYRYTHRAEERWQDGHVVSLDAETDDNGTPARVVVRRVPDGFSVEARGLARYVAPPEAMPATHWNRRMLDGPMINTQTGTLMRPVVTRLGPARLVAFGGAPITAEHFTLRGDADLDTWYDARPDWVALRFTASDGSTIRYERT